MPKINPYLFKPGQSGNPRGRPRGSKNKIAQLKRKLEKELPEIIAQLVKKAKDGDLTAIKIVLDRTLPVLRPIDAPAYLKNPQGNDLVEQGKAVIEAVTSGQLPANLAALIQQALTGQAKLVEVQELEKRVAALEDTPKLVRDVIINAE